MRRFDIVSLAVLFVSLLNAQSGAPAQNYDFVPGTKVIFSDDFAAAPVGEFPAKWEQQSGQAVVAEVAGKRALSILKDSTVVFPRMTSARYLPPSFTLEWDMYMPKDSFALYLFLDSDANKIGFDPGEVRYDGTGETVASYDFPDAQARENFTEKWHHVAIAVNAGQMKVYVDKARLFTVPDLHFSPSSIRFSGGESPVQLANVRIASGGGMNMVGKEFTDAKIVTHAINFATGSAEITLSSAGEIARIAGILRDNPSLRFEIGGHTDNVGAPAQNLTLSQQRAAAVRTALTAAGIDAARLTTKGYGDTVPLSPNTTAEGRANNRRVELTRLN
jgi:outer membrane protein OmpA-like peptidoglycan-associated protein